VNLISEKLKQLGLALPEAPEPIAQYVPATQVGSILFVSGQGPIVKGRPAYVGRVGNELALEDGYEAAKLCALNSLAVAEQLLGSLERVEQIVHVRGFVNSSPSFHDQPAVINGASDLFVCLFGDRGRHARAALGTSNLPGNIPVEIELVLAVKSG
jgi:enamine deaminase RidA (YjgF/YER057c/UK114 family)